MKDQDTTSSETEPPALYHNPLDQFDAADDGDDLELEAEQLRAFLLKPATEPEPESPPPTAEHKITSRFDELQDTAARLGTALASGNQTEARTQFDQLADQLAETRRTAEEAAQFLDQAMPMAERFAHLQDALRMFPDDPEAGLNYLLAPYTDDDQTELHRETPK